MKAGTIVMILLVAGIASATTMMLAGVHNAVSQLCFSLRSLLPVTAMTMLIFGGVIYASGQMMGAETRARANVWATACLTGALIGILMVVVAPSVLQSILGDAGTIDC